ncbi:hypothetical protein OVY48_22545 [Sphingobium sp. SA2]|uniref:hypothetical protein n=1 Tax=Sphingobium sp. SA2 TaxID=1524832 RepID=UPI0028C0F19E|nr:hypothetical protein [Sphingobium sp. SA2]MDT7536179.1 hypothetical protein [Sphingobium sp. SA2]
MDKDAMERRLTAILKKTESGKNLPSPGWWVGDVAAERRTRDDMAAGRVSWREAYRNAKNGLEALGADNLALAELYTLSANDFYIMALESRIRPSDWQYLTKSANARGRPKKMHIKSPRDFSTD